MSSGNRENILNVLHTTAGHTKTPIQVYKRHKVFLFSSKPGVEETKKNLKKSISAMQKS